MSCQARPNTAQRRRGALAVLLSSTLVIPSLSAQSTKDDPRDTTHSQKQAPFFTGRDARIAAGFAVTTALMIPLDKRIARRLRDSATQANRLFDNAATGVEIIASPGAYYIGGTMWLVGRALRHERLADLGWHGTEAVLFAQSVTYVIKGLAGRQRPFLSQGENPGKFVAGRGFSSGNWTSFPSGHTATAFAAAAAVTNETTRWWPRSTWIVGPLMYGGATAVGLSRMYHSRHWGSDVAIGAAIGTFSGRKMVEYAHGHPTNKLDRIMLRTSVIPDGRGGLLVGMSMER
jgi:membrane-associated phospholipid phosphatase